MKKWFLGSLLVGLIASSAVGAVDPTMSVQHLSGGNSYFSVNVQYGNLIKGSFPGWCADWAKLIEDNTPYSFKFYSSYSDNIPADLIDHPENLDEVNWIANQNFVGKDAGEGLGVYTAGDVQLAIWTLLDNTFDTDTVGPYSQARVDKIVSLAMENGSDFYPSCRQEIVIILDPGTPQSVLVEIKRNYFPKCMVPDQG